MDGKIIIGTELDTKQLEKNLAQLERESERLTKKKIKIEADLSGYEEEIRMLGEQHEQDLKLARTQEDINTENRITQKLLDEINEKYAPQIQAYNEINEKIKQNNANIEETKKNLEGLKETTNFKTELKGIDKSINVVGGSISRVIKKVGKWALALFGIRSIYSMIHNAMVTLSQHDKTLKTDIDYIKWSISQIFSGAIKYIINAVYKLLQVINTVFQKLFGINLFANATRKNFEKQQKAMSGTSKSAKQLQKTLAGFDEMNILQKNGETTSGGGGGGLPQQDLSKTIDIEKFLKDLWKKVKKWWNKIDWKKVGEKVGEKLAEVALLGIEAVKAVFSKEFWQGIWDAILKYDTFKNSLINSFYDKLKQGLGLKDPTTVGGKVGSWIVEGLKKVSLKFDWKTMLPGSSIATIATGVVTGIINAFTKLKTAIPVIFDFVKTKLQNAWGSIKDWVSSKVITPITNAFNNLKTTIPNIFTNIKTKISDIWTKVKNTINDNFITPVSKNFSDFKTKIGKVFDGVKDTLKAPLNVMIGWINKVIDGLNKISVKVPKWINKLLGNGSVESTWGFNIKKVPKLAKGGIVNMPGKGVPVATSGERGQEGVIPLTDSQQMALLGEAIGKYITINANITNTMNGRVISRELQKIQQENNFAGNR